MSFLFGTYYFARKIFTVPFMPSKVTWSFSAKEIQENLTLSTKNNVFITFQVSFKSVNRSGNKQFTPSCGSSSLETMTQYFTVWNVHITNLQSFTTVRFLKEEKKTFTKRNWIVLIKPKKHLVLLINRKIHKPMVFFSSRGIAGKLKRENE